MDADWAEVLIETAAVVVQIIEAVVPPEVVQIADAIFEFFGG